MIFVNRWLLFFLHTQPHLVSYNIETGTEDIRDQMVCIIGLLYIVLQYYVPFVIKIFKQWFLLMIWKCIRFLFAMIFVNRWLSFFFQTQSHVASNNTESAGFSDRTYMAFIVFLYEFNFKEVICDGHTLSVRCCNNQHFIHSLDSLLLSRQERFCEANQLIAHQTMKSYTVYVLSTEIPEVALWI